MFLATKLFVVDTLSISRVPATFSVNVGVASMPLAEVKVIPLGASLSAVKPKSKMLQFFSTLSKIPSLSLSKSTASPTPSPSTSLNIKSQAFEIPSPSASGPPTCW